jgi:hypothetical protein
MYPIWAMPQPRGGGYERDVTRPRIAVAAEPVSLATSLAHVLCSIDADDVVVIDLRDRVAPGGHFDAAIVNEGEQAPVDAAVVIELPGAGAGARPSCGSPPPACPGRSTSAAPTTSSTRSTPTSPPTPSATPPEAPARTGGPPPGAR